MGTATTRASSKPARATADRSSRIRRRRGDRQREQKQETREKLLDAARIVFENNSYITTSVDMIVEEAGISRSSFYRHFDGKLPLVAALFDEEAPELQGHWQQIVENPEPTHNETISWIQRYLDNIDSDPLVASVMREAMAIEPDLQFYTHRFYETVQEIIWNPETFARASHSSEIRAKSLLLLLQLDQFIYVLCSGHWQLDRSIMISVMAEQLRDFLLFRQSLVMKGHKVPINTAKKRA